MTGDSTISLAFGRTDVPPATSGILEGVSAIGDRVGTVLVRLVQLYQLAHQGRLPSCRFMPTCSSYAVEAIEVHGPVRGSWLAVRRLARCHPWGGHGADPVPPRGPAPC